ncbi:MAG: hypothetical protein WDO18_00510 [Acidobacteriota bacterium]
MKAFLHWAPVGLGVVFLLMITTLQSERVLSGKNDFAAFYAGGTLAGTPDLYSAEANVRLVEKTLGVHPGAHDLHSASLLCGGVKASRILALSSGLWALYACHAGGIPVVRDPIL